MRAATSGQWKGLYRKIWVKFGPTVPAVCSRRTCWCAPEMTDDHSYETDAWTSYWRSGQARSCFASSLSIDRRLALIWESLVDELPDNARILDLATGNGTVAATCAARARMCNKRMHIEGVDAADINPRACIPDPQRLLCDIRFLGGVRLEALPFEDCAFDAVVSQFGLEYASEEQACAEAMRVLAPDGRLQLVMHARDGAITLDIRLRLERLQRVLADDGPVTLALALSRAADAGDLELMKRKSAQLPAAVELTRRLAAHPPSDDAALFYSAEFLQLWAQRESYRASDLRRSIEQGWSNACGVAARQAQALQAARSAEDISRVCARLAAGGLTLGVTREIRDDVRDVQIAWMIQARRARA